METPLDFCRPRQVMRFACLLTVTGSAWGAGSAALSPAAYAQAREQVQAAYRGEREACRPLSGNARDICVQQVEGRRKIAIAHLDFQRSGEPRAMARLVDTRTRVRWEVARQMCDDEAAAARESCIAQARAEREQATADAKARKEVIEARNDETDARNKADYRAALERCDTLAGAARDGCIASAKARFNQ